MYFWTNAMALFSKTFLCVIGAFLSSALGSRPRLDDSPPRIAEHPSDLIVSRGEPATLNCKAEGRPTPIIEWYKDGERVITDREDPRSHRMLLPTGSLFFLRIVHSRRSKPDEGVYVCAARNYLGEAVSRNASLEVAILRDDFRQTPSDVEVATGEPAVMECIPPRGHPEPTISWKKDNVWISDKDERITIRGGKLMISNTKKSDAGMYICVATNMVGERDSDPAELVVFERPVFLKRPINQVVLANDTVDFQCEVQGDPVPTARWRKEEGELPQGRYEIRNDNSLMITRVSAEDEGTYTCITENSVGKAEASGTLSVHVGPFLPPQIVTRPRDQIVAQGRTVTFHCETKGNPPPAVFWQKEGSLTLLFPSQPPQPLGRFSVSLSGELTITDVQTGDSGYYMCQAISVAGSILAKALLEVEDVTLDYIPPIIRQGPANQTVAVDTTTELRCHAIGNPLPSIHWLKDGEKIGTTDPRISLLDNGTLQITNLQVKDSGMYVCVATSSSGETTWNGYLDVRENGVPSHAQPSLPNLLPGPPSVPLVTDVTKSSVTLTWQPSPHIGGSVVTSYIIEAFSQSAGSTWQTVADYVKIEKHTVSGLKPNTIYLFIVRAVNSYGLSDPSPISEPVRTQDVSPTGQGVDHRQVQRELGEVMVQLQTPIILTSTSIQVTWTVDRQSQYVQGYRVMYRTKSSAWLLQDVKASAERSTVLVELKKGTEYEIKIRPYFDEFQGMDSEVLVVQTPEEAPSASPRAVTVATVGLSNSTSISVSWEPPPAEEQNGIIQEYRIWCLGNETRFHVNKTVDGTVHSTIVRGLLSGITYHIEVAAATSAGIGVKSQPVPILIKPSSEQGPVTVDTGENISLTEQITDVVKQPAFIAGIGGACWVILMCFSVWIYCRRKKRKELSHYTASFAYTPAVSFPHPEGSGLINGRPGMLNANVTGYPWLADSWPTTNLLRSGNLKEASVNCCTGKPDSTDRYYNDAGISNYIAQTEKFGTGISDGPIYSTIDPASDEMRTFNGAYSQHTTPYATTPVVPFGGQNQYTPEHEGNHWNLQAGTSGVQYAQPDRNRIDNVTKLSKQKSMGKPVKTPSLNWSEALPPPPPANEIEYTEDYEQEEGSESEEWCPPLPERTYLMENIQEEECPPPPPRGEPSSPANSYGQQSTATLTPSPREELRASEDIPRLHQFEIPQLPRRAPIGPVLLPRPPTPPLTQSNPNINALEDNTEGQTPRPGHRRNLSQTAAFSAENVNSPAAGKARHAPGDNTHTPPGQKSRAKKKSKVGQYRPREHGQGDLPPPPEPPPAENLLDPSQLHGLGLNCNHASLERDGSAASSIERRQEPGHAQRKVAPSRHRDEDDIVPYSKPNFLSRGQMSSNCSTTGSSSSRGSTGSRGHGSGRIRTGDRSEDKR
ncbi:roundabout homolog 3 [Latimeria chalumnae]|uniref:roundabout homolog 3 n=1 Tax=Latimeria chalumnae TaxID=7897 RepID=UPI0006D926B1|nr:PREDICTED: roundabout homolog 3 isoform X2 [Latimeria chalumnae]|eukprot:XP_014341142.1 PREDICTED: roundabout homolog 3 isoform X2 [Latimeria chalumnae]